MTHTLSIPSTRLRPSTLSILAIAVILAAGRGAGAAAAQRSGSRPGAPAADATTTVDSIVGAWTLNADLSDRPPEAPEGGREGRPGGGGRRGGGPGGGRGRGGFGGGGRRGGGGGDPRAEGDTERGRQMAALRDLLRPADHLTVVATGTMVIVTAGDGRTTRLLLDGSAVTDESTKSERRTRWKDGTLVSQISGLGRGDITESYALEPATHRLIVSLTLENMPGPDGGRGRTVTRRYEADSR